MQTAYTAKAKKAIDIATRISKSLHHSYIGTEHILLGLLKEGTGVASQVLADNGVEYDKVLELIEELIAPGNAVAVLVDGLSPRAAHVLEVSKSGGGAFPLGEDWNRTPFNCDDQGDGMCGVQTVEYIVCQCAENVCGHPDRDGRGCEPV